MAEAAKPATCYQTLAHAAYYALWLRQQGYSQQESTLLVLDRYPRAAQTLHSKPRNKPIKCGTKSGYSTKGCRCDDCRNAARVSLRNSRLNRYFKARRESA